MRVRDRTPADQRWIEALLTSRWGGTRVIAHGVVFVDKAPDKLGGGAVGIRFRVKCTRRPWTGR